MKDMTEQGIQYYVAGRYAEAEPHLQRAVELNPNIELNRYRLGVTLCELKRYAEAEPHLQRAVELNPKDDANHSWLRNCHIGMGKVQKTNERLSTFVHTMSDRPSVIRQQPTREDPNSNILKQIQLGISLYQNNEFSEAIPLLKLGIDLNPRDEMNFYRLGLSFFKLRQYDMARPYLERAVELEPNDESNQYLLGASLYNLNQFAEAEQHLQKAVELNDLEENNCYLLGCCLYKLGSFMRAEEQLLRAVELKPNDNRDEGSSNKDWLQECLPKSEKQLMESKKSIARLTKEAGIRNYDAGKFQEAVPFLQSTAQHEPNNERNEYILGDCLYQLNRFSEAEPHLQRAVELNHTEENYCYLLGCCLCQLNRFSEAEPHLQRAVELKPGDNRDIGSTNKVWLQYCFEKLGQSLTKFADQRSGLVEDNVGIQFYNIGEFEKALPHLQYAVDIGPNNERSQYLLGNCLYQLNRFSEAEPHLQRAVELKSDDDQVPGSGNRFWLDNSTQRRRNESLREAIEVSKTRRDQYESGVKFMNERRFTDAITSFRQVLDITPTHNSCLFLLGICLFELGNYAESETFLGRALVLNPDRLINRLWIAVCLNQQQRYAEAKPYFQSLVESVPDNEEYRYWRGVNLVGLGYSHEAEPHLQRAVDIKPNDNRAPDSSNRAWLNTCQLNLPHRVNVADIFEEALARNSGDSVAFGDLGVTRLYQNRFAEALALFREALRLSPADFYKIQIVECYERLGNMELAQQMRLEYAELFEVDTTEPKEELPTPPTFSEFLSSGATWLEGAGWANRQQSPLLKSLHQHDAKWADPTKVLFPEYDIEEDDLAETLARAESLQHQLHLETEMPVYLQTEWVSVAMTIENGWIRAWVGIELEGCAVSLNPSTWDVQFLNADRDALFAAAVVVNWYIDCSIMLKAHPSFRKESENTGDEIRPWQLSDNGWSATSLFSDDVNDIREGRQTAPPRVHRVRGHKRYLTQRAPTDDARAKAPAYIRRTMGPNETWVQAHARGGQTETQNLLTRLHRHSSLADFLATAQLDSD